MDTHSVQQARWGAYAGFTMIALVLVFGLGGSMLIGAGSPLSGTTDEAVLHDYYSHAALAPMELWQVPAAVLGIAFFAGLREAVGGQPAARRLASLALHAFLVMAAGFAVVSALTAALVQQASAGAPLGTLFRLYDVLYNSHLDIASGCVVLLASLAVLKSRLLPKWIAVLGFAVTALYPVLALTPWTDIPAFVRPAVMLLFVAWFLSLATSLLRLALAANARGVQAARRPTDA